MFATFQFKLLNVTLNFVAKWSKFTYFAPPISAHWQKSPQVPALASPDWSWLQPWERELCIDLYDILLCMLLYVVEDTVRTRGSVNNDSFTTIHIVSMELSSLPVNASNNNNSVEVNVIYVCAKHGFSLNRCEVILLKVR